jgi:hypothetical protein
MAPTLALHGIGGVEMASPESYDFVNAKLTGVAPGRYTVKATAAGKVAYKTIDVGAGEYTFDVAMQAPPRIFTNVTFENPLPARARQFIGFDDDTTGVSTGYEIPPDGNFVSYVVGDCIRPRSYGTVPLFISGMSVDGAPIKDGLITRSEITDIHVNIVLSDRLGRLKGFALIGDRPTPAVLVVLAPAKGSPNALDYRGFQTENDGSFDYISVAAGDYLLFAVDRLNLEYTNPEVVRPYLTSAIPVHIDAHAVLEQKVSVTPAKGK